MKLKVIELFAGVGGFRLGMERYDKNLFEVVFANQWEPGRKVQHAFDCYVNNFGMENSFNEDIAVAKYKIPDNSDILVGGFPCQDYSVATTNGKGIEGKKGVLWWEISWIIKNKKPKMILLENVDRLLKSPSSKRGRDFAIMLKNLDNLGYDVEWQVINAADYGMIQRRKRVFIFAKKRSIFPSIDVNTINQDNINNEDISFFGPIFPVEHDEVKNITINIATSFSDEIDVTNNYNNGKFLNKGFLSRGNVFHCDYAPIFEGEHRSFQDVLEEKVDKKFFLNFDQLAKMKELKGAKKKLRTKPNGEYYYYSEGKMSLHDDVNKHSRTMITSEGTLNRSTHIIKIGRNKYRFITPREAERLNGFPDDWSISIPTNRMRYFCMGNALVVEIIEKLSIRFKQLLRNIKNNELKNKDIDTTSKNLKLI